MPSLDKNQTESELKKRAEWNDDGVKNIMETNGKLMKWMKD